MGEHGNNTGEAQWKLQFILHHSARSRWNFGWHRCGREGRAWDFFSVLSLFVPSTYFLSSLGVRPLLWRALTFLATPRHIQPRTPMLSASQSAHRHGQRYAVRPWLYDTVPAQSGRGRVYPCTHVELTLGGSMGYKVGYNEPLIYRDGLVERDILRLPSPLDNLLVESGPPRARGDRAAAAGNVRVSKRPWV